MGFRVNTGLYSLYPGFLFSEAQTEVCLFPGISAGPYKRANRRKPKCRPCILRSLLILYARHFSDHPGSCATAIESPAGMRTRATAPKPSAEKAVFAACQGRGVQTTACLSVGVLWVWEVRGSVLQDLRARPPTVSRESTQSNSSTRVLVLRRSFQGRECRCKC